MFKVLTLDFAKSIQHNNGVLNIQSVNNFRIHFSVNTFHKFFEINFFAKWKSTFINSSSVLRRHFQAKKLSKILLFLKNLLEFLLVHYSELLRRQELLRILSTPVSLIYFPLHLLCFQQHICKHLQVKVKKKLIAYKVY